MKTTTLLLATTVALCMSSSVWAAQVDQAAGAMRQDAAKPPEQGARLAPADMGDKPDPDALPHHQLNSAWRWHYRNTTTKSPRKTPQSPEDTGKPPEQGTRLAPPDMGDKPDPDALPHHQLNSAWRWHYRNTTTKSPRKTPKQPGENAKPAN